MAFGGKSKQVAADVYMPSQDPWTSKTARNFEDIIASRGYGYSPAMIDATTAPYAQSIRSGIQNYTLPNIYGRASAAGLGRSTIVGNQGRLAQQEGEYDIGQKIAERTAESEQLKAQQYASALAGLGNLGGQEVAAQNQARANAAQAQNLNRAYTQQQTDEWAKKGIALGSSVLGGIIGGPVGSALSGAPGIISGQPTTSSGKTQGAFMNISDNDLMDELMNLFGGGKKGKSLGAYGDLYSQRGGTGTYLA